MIRWFWLVYWPLSILLVAGFLFGPRLEIAVAPVLTDQAITEVTRDRGVLSFGGRDYPVGRLCWRWDRVKRRPLGFYSQDIDVFVDMPEDSASMTIFNRDTGAPWARSGAVAAGQVPPQHWCVLLPPSVSASDALRVRQTAHYPGWLGLWTLPVALPDIVNPPGAKIPG